MMTVWDKGQTRETALPPTFIMPTDFSDVLTNEALPKTSATITVRIIKSFEFRTSRNLVLRNLNLETTTVGNLKDTVRQGITIYQPVH